MTVGDSTTKASEPLLLWLSILSGLQIFLGGATTVSIVAESYLAAQIVALAMVGVGAAQAGIQFYLRGQVAPMEHVAEYVSNGVVIAGPANDTPGLQAGDVVRTLGVGAVGGPYDDVDEIDEYHGALPVSET